MIRPFMTFQPEIDVSAYIDESAIVIGKVNIGKDASIWPGAVLRADVSHIVIGARSNIQELTTIHVEHTIKEGVVPGYSTIIGDDVTVGHRVILHACTIENGVLIGMGAIVLDGAVIGKESIVGAGSLVTKGKCFAPRSLIMGSPAKFVRELADDEVKSLYRSVENYVALKNKYKG